MGYQVFFKYIKKLLQHVLLFLVLCALFERITAPFTPHAAARSYGTGFQSQIFALQQTLLQNIKGHGYNSAVNGLYVNWKYGTNPFQTNINGTGVAGTLPGHDPLTEIRYVHNLWLYKSQNPSDTQFDSELSRYTAIVKADYAGGANTRGWLYDEDFMDIYNLSGDVFYKNYAINMATAFSKSIVSSIGITFKTNAAHPQGYFRPSDDLQQACALIMAGTTFSNAKWVTQGKAMLAFLYTYTYISTYHTFADQMDQVETLGGAINPNEIFYIDSYRNYTIHGNAQRMGPIAQDVISLLNTYKITQDSSYLTKAQDLLSPFLQSTNSMGMWDSTSLGYFSSVTFSGTSPASPGTLHVDTTRKEAGRQILMLWAFHQIDAYTANMYQDMEAQMLTVALTKAYYSSGHGVIYEVSANWAPYNSPNGSLANSVTTEAMGAELESLFQFAPTGSMSLLLGSATPSAVTSHTISFTPSDTTDLVKTISLQYTTLPGSSTVPAGLVISATPLITVTNGGSQVLNSAVYAAGLITITLTNPTLLIAGNGNVSIVINTVTNPSSGNFFLTLTTTMADGVTVTDTNISENVFLYGANISGSMDFSLSLTITGIAAGVSNLGGMQTTTGSTTGSVINFGTFNIGTNTAAQQVTTISNAANGYTLSLQENAPLTSSGGIISDLSAPTTWQNNVTAGFGVNVVSGTNGDTNTALFSQNSMFLPIPQNTSSLILASTLIPIGNSVGDTENIFFQAGITGLNASGSYTNVLNYIATPNL